MSVSFENKSIGNGITFSKIIDKKFKSNCIVIRFISPLSIETSSRNSLLVDLLSTSNSKFPTREGLTQRLYELYGSSMNSFSYRVSNSQVVGLAINFIGDSYSFDDEIISKSATEIILNSIFSPAFENEKFSELYFKLRKQELIDMIKNLINNKRQYAVFNAAQTLFAGEANANLSSGTVETATAVTQDDLISAYDSLLKKSAISITFCGGEISSEGENNIINAFTSLDREFSDEPNFYNPSPIKDNVAVIEESLDVQQCKMVMGFKSENNNLYLDKIMCAMFGGSPTSKLFTNVREKLSLCYYCASSLVEGKNTMIVDSGVEQDKIEIAQKEILNQLEAIKNGDFSDEMLENTKLYVIGAFRSNYDTVSDMNSWYFYQLVRGDIKSPDQVAEIVRAVTREDVMKSACGFKLDTVYTLISDKGGNVQ